MSNSSKILDCLNLAIQTVLFTLEWSDYLSFVTNAQINQSPINLQKLGIRPSKTKYMLSIWGDEVGKNLHLVMTTHLLENTNFTTCKRL